MESPDWMMGLTDTNLELQVITPARAPAVLIPDCERMPICHDVATIWCSGAIPCILWPPHGDHIPPRTFSGVRDVKFSCTPELEQGSAALSL